MSTKKYIVIINIILAFIVLFSTITYAYDDTTHINNSYIEVEDSAENNNTTNYKSFSRVKKNSTLSPNLFRNRELQNSLSIKVNDNPRTITNLKFVQNYNSLDEPKSSFLTMIPITNTNVRSE